MSSRYLSISPQIAFSKKKEVPKITSAKTPFLCMAGFLLLSQCTLQGPPKVIVLRESEILVQQGDTIYSLAHRYNVSVRGLVETNGLVPPYTLSPDQKLVLPSSGSCSPSSSTQSSSEDSVQGPQLLEGGAEVQWEEVGPVETPSAQGEASCVNPSLMEEARKSNALMHQKDSSSAPNQASLQGKKGGAGGASAPKKQICFSSPVKSVKGRPKENGICLTVLPGEKVRAAAPGRVLFAGSRTTSEDPLVLIQHEDGWLTAYGPFEKISVSKDQCVTPQTPLGTIKSNKELYFEMRKDRKVENPVLYIK